MKKIALLLAMVMILVCVLVSCNGTTEESKGDTSKEVSTTDTSKETEESKAPVENSQDESEEPEESKGPEYAEGTTEIDRTLTPTSVTVGLETNDLVSDRGEADKWANLRPEVDGALVNKLTNGIKSNDGNDQTDFFGTAGESIEIIIDLGEVVDGLADFSLWSATNSEWGISVIDGVQFFVSDDGENWLPIADEVLSTDLEAAEVNGNWNLYEFKVELEKGVSAQYVKCFVNKVGHKWISEFNVDVYK